tara:strand:- start:6353 stop:6589 length:237 start_codon:yes stop_codon:yes gene_type:complete
MTERAKDSYNLIGWLATFFILLGYYLNANKHPECWTIWIVGNLLMGFYCHKKEAYPASVMSFVIVIMNLYGWINWTQT